MLDDFFSALPVGTQDFQLDIQEELERHNNRTMQCITAAGPPMAQGIAVAGFPVNVDGVNNDQQEATTAPIDDQVIAMPANELQVWN